MNWPDRVALQFLEYPGLNTKTTATTEQALLTNNKPKPHVRCSPSETTKLATPFITYCASFVSFSGWLLIFITCHWSTERHRTCCGHVVQHVCALIRRHCTFPTHGIVDK
uniref:Uncharacterized protein n=1 Tax=Mesocestoides corti TaxID=53468 RepID=A0A5K3F916_MESCO